MTTNHSPLPWIHESHALINASTGRKVLHAAMEPEDRAFMLTAVNSHYALVKALQQMVETHSHNSLRESVMCKPCGDATNALRAVEGR